eukprot:357325-Chlamydomonas_euryale.AAC.3
MPARVKPLLLRHRPTPAFQAPTTPLAWRSANLSPVLRALPHLPPPSPPLHPPPHFTPHTTHQLQRLQQVLLLEHEVVTARHTTAGSHVE